MLCLVPGHSSPISVHVHIICKHDRGILIVHVFNFDCVSTIYTCTCRSSVCMRVYDIACESHRIAEVQMLFCIPWRFLEYSQEGGYHVHHLLTIKAGFIYQATTVCVLVHVHMHDKRMHMHVYCCVCVCVCVCVKEIERKKRN